MTQTTPTPDLPTLMTTAQAAAVFGRSRRWVVYLIRSGQLPATLDRSPGIPGRGVYRIDAEDCFRLMRLHQHGQGRRPIDPADLT